MKPPSSNKVIPALGCYNGKSSLASKTKLSPGKDFYEKKTLTGVDLPTTLSSTERAARLKLRFADIILQADPDMKVNLEKLEQEQKLKMGVNLERLEQEERLKVKGPKQEEQFNSKILQIENDRKAAKEALEKLEKRVNVDDNFKVMRDFEKLINAPPQDFY